MGIASLIQAARGMSNAILTDEIEVTRLDKRVTRGYDTEDRRDVIYRGPALVQIAANTRVPIQEIDTGAVSRAVVKVPVNIKLVVNDRVEVIQSLDQRQVGRVVVLGDTLQQGWAIVGRYYGNFTEQRART